MGAFISYLHLARGINNFFVLAPNLTIYNKLIADFTPNTRNTFSKALRNLPRTFLRLLPATTMTISELSLLDLCAMSG